MNIQNMLDTFDRIRKENNTSLTIGTMLKQLDKYDDELEIVIDGSGYKDYIDDHQDMYKENPQWREEYGQLYFDNTFGSYRGYYEDMYLGITKKETITKVKNLKSLLNEAKMKKYMYGYKGGDFTIDDSTILWLDEYSCCKQISPISLFENNGKLVLITKYQEM